MSEIVGLMLWSQCAGSNHASSEVKIPRRIEMSTAVTQALAMQSCKNIYLTMWHIDNQATSDAFSSSAIFCGMIDDAAKACSEPAMRSPTSSMPTDRRTTSAAKPRRSPTSGGTLACDMHPGRLMVELILPKLTQMLNICAASTMRRELPPSR